MLTSAVLLRRCVPATGQPESGLYAAPSVHERSPTVKPNSSLVAAVSVFVYVNTPVNPVGPTAAVSVPAGRVQTPPVSAGTQTVGAAGLPQPKPMVFQSIVPLPLTSVHRVVKSICSD